MIKPIWIPGNVPSSKNSRVFNLQMKRSFKSKSAQRWERETKSYWIKHRARFLRQLSTLEPPFEICFTFVRGTKHKFDYINAAQIVQDAMVRHAWIEDDNCTILRPSFGEYEYDKEEPGVWIEVLR